MYIRVISLTVALALSSACSALQRANERAAWRVTTNVLTEMAAGLPCYGILDVYDTAPTALRVSSAEINGERVGGYYSPSRNTVTYTSYSTLIHEYVHAANAVALPNAECYNEITARLVQALVRERERVERLQMETRFLRRK